MESLTAPLVRARDEGRDAFEHVVRLAAPSVVQFVAIEMAPEEVDDVVLDVFRRAWRRLPKYPADTDGRVWLFTIARRASRDAVRWRTRRNILRHAIGNARPRATTADPSPRLEIIDRIGCLARDRRQAFVLTELVGLTYRESGQVCGVSATTIRSRVAWARSELIGLPMG